MKIDLGRLCEKVAARAKKLGATQAEAYAERSREASVRVRDGEIEDLTEATSKGLGLRVIRGGRLGFAWTSDFSDDGLESFVKKALDLAALSAKDEKNRLPGRAALKQRNAAPPGLFDPEVEALSTDWKIQAALEMERAARAEDRRIAGFESVGAGDYVAEVAVASTEGFVDTHRGTYVSLYAVPVAKGDGGELQNASWSDTRRRLADLMRPEEIGRIAARRAARMLGAKKAATQRVPVVFEAPMAAGFVAGLAGAVNGDAILKRSSFLAGKLGAKLAPATVTVVDDGLLPGGLGTHPFDGEGVPTRRTPVIERGVLRSYLYDTYTAGRAKTASTGNASRSYASLPHVGVTNFYLDRGATPAEELVKGVKNGLLVTFMLGRGVNTVTGEYSRGANGIWIRDGELAEPVQEITVAGNMLEMLAAIDAVGDDLEHRGTVASPSLRFAELTVAGA